MSTTHSGDVLDVRPMHKPDKHPAIFAAYDALKVGESFILVNDHDPRHLHEEFETEHSGSYGWEYVSRERRDWRIRITKQAGTPLPRVLANTNEVLETADASGAIWKLQVSDRDLDSNVISLPPSGTIDQHTGPDLDVLIHVLSGDGAIATELGDVAVAAGALVFLPRRSQRGFTAGPDGLRYLTVHQKRTPLPLNPTVAPASER